MTLITAFFWLHNPIKDHTFHFIIVRRFPPSFMRFTFLECGLVSYFTDQTTIWVCLIISLHLHRWNILGKNSIEVMCLKKKKKKWCVFFSASYQETHNVSFCHLGNVKFGCLVEDGLPVSGLSIFFALHCHF